MSSAGANALPQRGTLRPSFYYGWVNLGVAALAMVATLPGRTQGLGLVTEPLMRDLELDRVLFAEINLVATLVGSLFCLGIGRLIDRAGSRAVLTAVSLGLGAVVLGMSRAAGVASLLLFVTLTRGLGQSALSVVSLALVGKWFSRRLSLAMGVYAVAMSIGFMAAFPAVGAVEQRMARGLGGDRRGDRCGARPPVLAAGALHASGIALFNESILALRGFEPAVYHRSLVVTALTALAGNFAGGAFAAKGSLKQLMAAAMLLLTGSLLALPHVTREAHVMAYAVVMGLAGGFVMVIFFSFWGRAYGRAHLGRIQGAAQILTVLASAIGPLVLAQCVAWTGSYAMAFYVLASIVAALGVAAALVPLPEATDATSAPEPSSATSAP